MGGKNKALVVAIVTVVGATVGDLIVSCVSLKSEKEQGEIMRQLAEQSNNTQILLAKENNATLRELSEFSGEQALLSQAFSDHDNRDDNLEFLLASGLVNHQGLSEVVESRRAKTLINNDTIMMYLGMSESKLEELGLTKKSFLESLRNDPVQSVTWEARAGFSYIVETSIDQGVTWDASPEIRSDKDQPLFYLLENIPGYNTETFQVRVVISSKPEGSEGVKSLK